MNIIFRLGEGQFALSFYQSLCELDYRSYYVLTIVFFNFSRVSFQIPTIRFIISPQSNLFHYLINVIFDFIFSLYI